MLSDNVGTIARKDPPIITVGNFWMRHNIKNKSMPAQYTSGAMQLVSRLLQALVTPESGTDLADYLKTKHFDDVARASLLICLPDAEDEKSLKAPSNGLKMTIQVRKLCVIKRARSLKNEDRVRRKEAKQFLELMDGEWETKLERLLWQRGSLGEKIHYHCHQILRN